MKKIIRNNNPTVYLIIDSVMSKIAHKWVIKIGQVGGGSKRKTSGRLTDYNEGTAISTKGWVEFFSFEIKDLKELKLQEVEVIIREHELWNNGLIRGTELVIYRSSINDVHTNCEKIIEYLRKNKGLKISAKKLFKAGGRDVDELKRVSKEIEKRIKLKDDIDKLLGKFKKYPNRQTNSDLEELKKLNEKQIKLEF